MTTKTIVLSFDLEQVCNDVLAKCNLIATSIRDAAMEDIKANVLEPDNPETRSIICRAVTEAFGKVKVAAQRYLNVGRSSDTNALERLVTSVTYSEVPVTQPKWDSEHNSYIYSVIAVESNVDVTHHCYWDGSVYKDETTNDTVTPKAGTTPVIETETVSGQGDVTSMTFETVILTFVIPNFNLSVTDHLKSMIHKYVVDWVMARFLQDQLADKAAEYKELADGEDYTSIILDLNARERFIMRKPGWM